MLCKDKSRETKICKSHITAMEVTESAAGPDPIRLVLADDVLHHSVLLLVDVMSLMLPMRGPIH